jgi:hypothetical protein
MNTIETTKYGVDLDKIRVALDRIRGTVILARSEKLRREHTGNPNPYRHLSIEGPIKPPEDISRRKYVPRMSKGCKGFFHPDFHP